MASVFPNASASSSAPRRGAACCVVLALLFLGVTPEPAARADELPAAGAASRELKDQCADAYEATQRERSAGRLLAARAQGIFCAQASCPEVLRGDCARWVGEIANGVPSLVIEARTPAGELVTAVRVLTDGAPWGDHLDGRSREIDPGRHRFRFESLGFFAQERELVVVEGREQQRLSVVLQPQPTQPLPARRVPAASYVLAGVGVVGLASFAYFGLAGNAKKSDLSRCQPACAASRREPIERDYLAADISLGVSLASFGISAWLALAGHRPTAAPSLDVRAGSQGALLAYRAGF